MTRDPKVRISDITEDHAGRLWIATNEDGLYSYDARTDLLQHYRYDPDDPATISRNAVNTLAVDRTNRLWIGTNGYGLCSYNEKTVSFAMKPCLCPVRSFSGSSLKTTDSGSRRTGG